MSENDEGKEVKKKTEWKPDEKLTMEIKKGADWKPDNNLTMTFEETQRKKKKDARQ
jgi:hypothetical protein